MNTFDLYCFCSSFLSFTGEAAKLLKPGIIDCAFYFSLVSGMGSIFSSFAIESKISSFGSSLGASLGTSLNTSLGDNLTI